MPSRKRSPHPGIVVLKPQPETRRPALIRFRDPSTGKFKHEKLPELPEAELKRWLVRRALKLQQERLDGPAPAPRPAVVDVGFPLAKAVEEYFDGTRLRPQTIASYRSSTAKLLNWPERPGSLLDIDMARLRNLRGWLGKSELKAVSVNHHLRQLGAFFNYWRKAGKCPKLNRDDLADGLEPFEDDSEKKDPLSLAEIRQLVVALNRFIGDESEGAEENGRFRALVLCLLLTGMRAGEGLMLRPEHLLDGAILLTEDITKTKRRRMVDLSVCPSVKFPKPVGGNVFGIDRRRFEYIRIALLKDAPADWTPQRLRVTCGTYLTCAPGIYGGSSAYMSAARLGHSVQVAERHYVGMVKVPPTAKTLEEAMGIADLLEK